MARQNKAELDQLLRLDASDDATRIVDVLNCICDIRLVDFQMSGFDGILERLSQRLEKIDETDDEFGLLILDLIEYSIRE